MRSFRPAIIVALLASSLALSPSGAVQAASKIVTPAPVDERKLIQSVDAATGTIVIRYMRGKTTHTYKVDEFAKLTINNAAGKVSQIKTGMEVADYTERDNDNLDSLVLTGSGGSLEDKAKPKKK